MDTIAAPVRQAQGELLERVRDPLAAVRANKMRHAHALASAIFRYYRDQEAPGTGQDLSEFQRALILKTAAELGFPVASRAELSGLQLAKVCNALRNRMDELGIPIPRSSRNRPDPSAGSWSSRAESRDERSRRADTGQTVGELLAVIFDLAGQVGWDQAQLDRFTIRQLRGYGTSQIESEEHAQAVLGGLKGIQRHTHSAGERKSKAREQL